MAVVWASVRHKAAHLAICAMIVVYCEAQGDAARTHECEVNLLIGVVTVVCATAQAAKHVCAMVAVCGKVNLHVGTVVVKYAAVQCEAALEQWRLRARE
jgi:hypothetical protein